MKRAAQKSQGCSSPCMNNFLSCTLLFLQSMKPFCNFCFLQTSKIIAAAQGDYTTTPYTADGQQAAAAVAAAVAKNVGKSNVIRAVIEKLWYPITVEVLYKV